VKRFGNVEVDVEIQLFGSKVVASILAWHLYLWSPLWLSSNDIAICMTVSAYRLIGIALRERGLRRDSVIHAETDVEDTVMSFPSTSPPLP
jgi:hypothetical protein